MNDDVPPWPPEFADRYRAQGYWRGLPLGTLMWQWADDHGARTALVDGDTRIGYRGLAEQADLLAERLRQRGLRRGDRVLVQLPNCWEFVVVLLACLRAGAVAVLALMPHREHELGYLVRHTEPRMIFVPDRWRGFDHLHLAESLADGAGQPCAIGVVGDDVRTDHLDVRGVVAVRDGDTTTRRRGLDSIAPSADDIALFLLSGGTTGLPKLIGRTHNDYEYCWRSIGGIVGAGTDTAYLVTLPASHNFALGGPGILGTMAAGGKVVLAPSPEPRHAFDLIARERVTMTSLVPAVAQRWVETAEAERPDLTSLRVVQVGGSVLDPVLARRIPRVLGGKLQQVFGMAEGLLNCTRLDDRDDVVFGTQGRPISEGDEVSVVDGDGEPVPPGEVGELLTRGPYTPRGYYRSPEHNLTRFTPDGWYRTGDLVRWHPSGNLVVEGRSKDLVNRGGEKVSADEVECLARELLDISAAAVVPVADTRLGERVCLVVEVADGQVAPDLEVVRSAFLAHGVAHYKTPEQVQVLGRLPLTPVGKVDKVAVRRLLARESNAQTP